MDEKALSYFSSVNPIARKIIKDEVFLRNAIGQQWNNLDLRQQEDLIDDFIVDVKVREIYTSVEKTENYPLSFPKLKVDTGERINVEFEDDCWTWQDEHSSPFNWRTKSQQDLTLADLELEVLSKPVGRARRKESDSQPAVEPSQAGVKLAPQEFTVQSGASIWDSPFLQGVKKPEFLNRSRSASPTKSGSASRESLSPPRSKSPEEVNYAFSGSLDDLSSSASLNEAERSMSVSSGECLDASPSHTANIEVSPSHTGNTPKPPKRHRKSPIKTALSAAKKADPEQYSEALVSKKNDEEHAFDNPTIANEWSSFVNDNPQLEAASASSTPSKRLLKEAEPVHMELKEPEPVCIERGDYSGGADASEEFHDEVLVVEVTEGGGAVLGAGGAVQGAGGTVMGDRGAGLDETDAMNASTLSKTGFDFLDNW